MFSPLNDYQSGADCCRLNYGLKLSECVAGGWLPKPIRDTFQSGRDLSFVFGLCHAASSIFGCVAVPCACLSVCVCECNSAYNYNIYLVNSFYIFISISLTLFHTFIAIFLFLFAAHIGDYFPALNEFSTHTVIRPKVQHGRTRRALQSTLDATVSGSCATAMSCKVKMKGKMGMEHLQREIRHQGIVKANIPARKNS